MPNWLILIFSRAWRSLSILFVGPRSLSPSEANRATQPSQGVTVTLAAIALALATLAPFSGCATNKFQDSLSATSDSSARAQKGGSSGPTTSNDSDAGWNSYGPKMRSDQPVRHEEDGLKNLFVSPRAQEIERSLGVE